MAKNNFIGRLARNLGRMLAAVALLGVAGSAFAAGNVIAAPGQSGSSAWTVYAFGNAQAVSDAFRAIANFSASGTFQSIVGLIAVLGVLGVGLSGGFNPAMAKRFIGYVVAVFLVCYTLFGVTNDGPLVVNAEVIDSVDMTWKAPVTVPAVVGIPASIISTAGYRITQAIEASFSLPDELKMSNGAPFNLAAAMISDASQARIADPNLASSLSYYVQDCFTVAVARGELQASTLITSTDFLSDIRFAHPGVMVNTLLDDPAGVPSIVSCDKAWTLINTAVNAQGGMAADFLKSASAWSKTPAMSVVNAAADSTAQWATNGGVTDGGALVKQSAVLSAFRGAYSQAASQTGNSEFLTTLATTQATEAQRSSWITGAEIFNKTMGYIFAILQVFVYAITPLVLCAALVPGLGMALLKNFSQILLWLAIWQPMLAIVNFIVISMQQADLGGILSDGGSGFGFTLANMGIVSEKASNLRAAASFVGTMVPALAWAMVKGSVDFSRVIGAAVGENFAQGAANTMTTGNYSLNQASMDSFTSNKHSTAATGAFGEGFSTASTTGSRAVDFGGTSMPKLGEQQMGLGVGASQNANASGQQGSSAQLATGGGHTASATAASAVSTQTSDAVSGGHALSSAGITSASANLGANAGAAVVQPSRGPANNGQTITGTNLPAGAAGGGGAQPPAAGSVGGKEQGPGRLRADLTAGAGTSLTGQNSDVRSSSEMHTSTTTASQSKTGSDGHSATESGSYARSANESKGYTEGVDQRVTGFAGNADRAAVFAAGLAGQRRHNPLTGHSSGGTASSPLGDTVHKLGGENAVGKDVQAAKNETHSAERNLTKQTDGLRNAAHAQQGQVAGAAAGEMRRTEGAVAAAKAPAQVSATSRAVETAGRVGHDLKEDTKALAHAAGKAAGLPDTMLEHLKPESKTAPDLHRDGGQPAKGGQQKPEERSVASNDQQRQQEQQDREREQQARQLAAAAAAAQALQVAQAHPQAQAPAGQAEAPMQLAQAELPKQPMPDTQGQSAAPNPFSGEKSGESSSQLQGQIQMAEQKVERLDNQRRTVDGMLASAEGRKPSELPELINQAREVTRNA